MNIAECRSLFMVAVAIAIAGLTGSVQAATYKWVDEQGQVHYTQSPPPPGVQGEAVKPPPKVDTESAVKTLKAKDQGFNKRLEDKAKAEEEAGKKSAAAADKAKYCDDLRKNLAGLQSAQRIYEGEGDSRRRITEEERQARIKGTEEKLAKDCA